MVSRAKLIDNTNRRTGPIGEESPTYYRVRVYCDGSREWLLFTPREFSNAAARARTQPEDLKQSLLEKIRGALCPW